MFNGIIKNTGVVKKIVRRSKSMNITVLSNIKIEKNMIGSSISCNGVCLTLISKKKKISYILFVSRNNKKIKFFKN